MSIGWKQSQLPLQRLTALEVVVAVYSTLLYCGGKAAGIMLASG